MKSMGQFIAALRKAGGMTQKELAEKLCVSDKAISRWERDECAPDVTLIPVIAEIFGVSSDEILRGERILKSESTPADNAKVEKQLERLLNSLQTNFSVRTIIAIGLCALGLIAAMICNSVVENAQLGFMIACMFYVISAICETIFATLAIASGRSSDIESEKLASFRRSIYRVLMFAYGAIIIFFAATLPLILFPMDSSLLTDPTSWFIDGGLYVILAIALSAAVVIISNLAIISRRSEGIDENLKERAKSPYKRVIIYLLVLLLMLGGTFAGHIYFINNTHPYDFLGGKVYTDIEEFVEFLETPDEDYNGEPYVWTLTRPFIPPNLGAKEICVVEQRKLNIGYSTEWNSDGSVVFTVRTDEDQEEAEKKYDGILMCFVLAYFIEIVIVGAVYYFRKKRIG